MLKLLNFRLDMDQYMFAIKVETDDFECDLHNFADFVGVDYNVKNQELLLCWTVRQDHGVPQLPAPFNALDLVFRGVDYLEISPRDSEMPDDEDTTLDTISYMAASDDLKDYLHNDVIPVLRPDTNRDVGTDYHVLFRFRGGQMIRVGARQARLNMTCKPKLERSSRKTGED